jgi:hypothetical protein
LRGVRVQKQTSDHQEKTYDNTQDEPNEQAQQPGFDRLGDFHPHLSRNSGQRIVLQ